MHSRGCGPPGRNPWANIHPTIFQNHVRGSIVIHVPIIYSYLRQSVKSVPSVFYFLLCDFCIFCTFCVYLSHLHLRASAPLRDSYFLSLFFNPFAGFLLFLIRANPSHPSNTCSILRNTTYAPRLLPRPAQKIKGNLRFYLLFFPIFPSPLFPSPPPNP